MNAKRKQLESAREYEMRKLMKKMTSMESENSKIKGDNKENEKQVRDLKRQIEGKNLVIYFKKSIKNLFKKFQVKCLINKRYICKFQKKERSIQRVSVIRRSLMGL